MPLWQKTKGTNVRQKLGWCPNDEKPNEQRINRDRTYGVQMMRNQRNKKET